MNRCTSALTDGTRLDRARAGIPIEGGDSLPVAPDPGSAGGGRDTVRAAIAVAAGRLSASERLRVAPADGRTGQRRAGADRPRDRPGPRGKPGRAWDAAALGRPVCPAPPSPDHQPIRHRHGSSTARSPAGISAPISPARRGPGARHQPGPGGPGGGFLPGRQGHLPRPRRGAGLGLLPPEQGTGEDGGPRRARASGSGASDRAAG